MRVTGSSSLKISTSLARVPPTNSLLPVSTTPPQLPSPKEPPALPVCAVKPSGSPVIFPQQSPSSPPVLTPPTFQDYHVPCFRSVLPASIVVPAARPYFDKTPDVSLGFNFVDVLRAMRAPPVVEVNGNVDISEPFANIPSQPINPVTLPKPAHSEETVSAVIQMRQFPSKPSAQPTNGPVHQAENLPIFTAATRSCTPRASALSSVVKTTSQPLDIIQVPNSTRRESDRGGDTSWSKNVGSASSSRRNEPSTSLSQHPKDPRIDKSANKRKQVPEVSSSTELRQKTGAQNPEVGGNAETDILLRLGAIATSSPPSRRRSNPEVTARDRNDGGRRRNDVRRKRSPSPDRLTRRRSNPEVIRERGGDRVRDREADERGESRPVKKVRNIGERQNFEPRTKPPVPSTANKMTASTQVSQDPNEASHLTNSAKSTDDPGEELTPLGKLGYRHSDQLGIFIGQSRQN